ncbi:hypothetical protein FHG87_000987 [Trinorchestia longiramus]|nr:hypothetical protein FHG87_000987 [Trinorchestia longiramus]
MNYSRVSVIFVRYVLFLLTAPHLFLHRLIRTPKNCKGVFSNCSLDLDEARSDVSYECGDGYGDSHTHDRSARSLLQLCQQSTTQFGFAVAEDTDPKFSRAHAKILGRFLANFAEQANIGYLSLCPEVDHASKSLYTRLLLSWLMKSGVLAGTCDSVSLVSQKLTSACSKMSLHYPVPTLAQVLHSCKHSTNEMRVHLVDDTLQDSTQKKMVQVYQATKGVMAQMVLGYGDVARLVGDVGMMWSQAVFDNATMEVTVHEIYQFRPPGQYLRKFVGIWTPEIGMHDFGDLGHGPLDFMGYMLVVTAFHYEPYFVEVEGDGNYEYNSYYEPKNLVRTTKNNTGLMVQIIDTVAQQLNFT